LGRIYLHLADDWLATQYRTAAEAIDAQVLADRPVSAQLTDSRPTSSLTAGPLTAVRSISGGQR
jgi:integrase/recombinase XerD